MGTYEQMMVDNRYSGEFNHDQQYSSKQRPVLSHKDDDGNGSQGRRVYLESPSFGNKEEEDMYRYVPSRLTDGTRSIVGPPLTVPTGVGLMDSLDFDLDLLNVDHTRSDALYRQPPKPALGTQQLSNMPRADPRQDPLLGPLLAELDAMSNQQKQLPESSSSNYRRNFVPYQPNLIPPIGSSPSNHALTNIANRTVNDALLDAELYNPHYRSDHPVTTLNSNPLNHTRTSNMEGTDIFMPSSHGASAPGSFLSHFGPDDQLFQRPMLNNLGQNYVPNPRPPPPPLPLPPPPPQQQQRDVLFDQAQRTTYAPPRNYYLEQQQQQMAPPQPPNPFIEYQRAPPQLNPADHQELFFTDHSDEQVEQQQQQQQQQPQLSHRHSDYQDQDSRRQAVWNELQRTNAKVHEKNTNKKHHESATRNRAPFGSSINWNNTGSQQSSAISKSPQRPFHQPPPISKPNHVEDNIDMIKNKENFYHRYPPRKYENSYTKRQEFQPDNVYDKQEQEPKILSPQINPQRHASLPVTVNLNTGDNSQSGVLPTTVAIPLDSHINRVGDKISVNIDLRLVDLQNLQQQQQQQHQTVDHPQWASGDPLDRHIRKMERNIEHNLPPTHPPQRSPVIPMASTNPSLGRYGKPPGRGGYNPPVYGGGGGGGGDYYGQNDRNREEDSYLAKMNYSRRNTQFKPYTGRDYEQFKKNFGFGTGYLAHDFESTTHKEKAETLAKTRQYAQQIEARNKKKLTESSRRTLSDTRLPKASRPFEYRPSPIRPKQFSGKSTNSSPAILSEIVPFIPARRPTEVLYRPIAPATAPRLTTKLPVIEPKEIIEREKPPVYSPIKRREERVVPERISPRRLSPPKHLPTSGSNVSKRRPIRFDDAPKQPATNDEQKVMDVVRQELNDRPLNPNEELVVIEP